MLIVLWGILGVLCVRLDMMGVHLGMLRVLWRIEFDSSLLLGIFGAFLIMLGVFQSKLGVL